jgi:Chlamydia polymorphic membrane protein (Chlamydia_PMP) repeat
MVDTTANSTPPTLEPTRRNRANRSGSNPKTTGHRLAGALAAISTAVAVHGQHQRILYVDDDAPPGGNGQSWGTALRDLQDALALASFSNDIDVVYIAQGVYTPDRGTGSRFASFEINDNPTLSAITFSFGLKGGFAGVTAPDPNVNDPTEYVTILSGDLNGDDGPGFTNRSDNSIRIMRIDRAFPTLIGLVFTGGESGIYKGSAIYANDGFSAVDCTFVSNRSWFGGAVHHEFGWSYFTRCFFGGNSAQQNGGAVSVFGRGHFFDCVFSGNTSGSLGGAVFDSKGAQFNNCTFFSNTTGSLGGGIFSEHPDVQVYNSMLVGNTPSQISRTSTLVEFSLVEGGFRGVGNITELPTFVNPSGRDGIVGTQDDDLRLDFGSWGIDAGDAFRVRGIYDFAGLPRRVDDPYTPNIGAGPAPTPDMGAYEFQPPVCYADLDQSTGVGVLDVFDFLRFQNLFVMNDPLACQIDRSTGPHLCDLFDFIVFQDEFAAGCP